MAMKRWITAGALLVMTAGTALATEGPTVAMGQTLFESTALGVNGKSCASCHPAGKGLEEIAAYDDPMLKEMINFCVRDALEGKMFAPESQELDSMLLYLRTLPQK
jgi:mono/diheme cytochrome c family protein